MLQVRDCTPDDFRAIAPHLRDADVEEWFRYAGIRPVQWLDLLAWPEAGINRIVADSDTGMDLCAWGANDLGPKGQGWVWLVARPEAVPQARAIHRHLKTEFTALTERWPRLVCASWDGNTKHHQWLRWLGFTQGTPRRFPSGSTFIPFTYEVAK